MTRNTENGVCCAMAEVKTVSLSARLQAKAQASLECVSTSRCLFFFSSRSLGFGGECATTTKCNLKISVYALYIIVQGNVEFLDK